MFAVTLDEVEIRLTAVVGLVVGGDVVGVVAVLVVLLVSEVQHENLLADAHSVPVSGLGSEGLGFGHGLLLGSLLCMATCLSRAAHSSLPAAPREHCVSAHLTFRLQDERELNMNKFSGTGIVLFSCKSSTGYRSKLQWRCRTWSSQVTCACLVAWHSPARTGPDSIWRCTGI